MDLLSPESSDEFRKVKGSERGEDERRLPREELGDFNFLEIVNF